jgi:hypothetical protein
VYMSYAMGISLCPYLFFFFYPSAIYLKKKVCFAVRYAF